MATVSSLGAGSGLDLNGLIDKLMAAEQQPITQVQSRSTEVQSKISAFGTVKGLMSTLQTAAEALNTKDKFSSYKTSVADETVATVAASGSANTGNHTLEVTQLAAAQSIKSPTGYAATTSTIATGTLTLEIGTTTSGAFTADGTKTKTINITSSNNTLGGLRDAINATNSGVTASIINDGSGTPYRLVLTSDNSGTANSFKLSGLAGFDFDPATETGSLSKIQSSKDALFKLDGIDIKKSSNVVTDAMDGLTITLKKTNDLSPTTISVTSDTSAIKDKINAFVKAYNDVNSKIKDLTAYNSSTKVAAALNGDSAARTIRTELRNIVSGTLSSGTMTRLNDAGIKIATDGTLSVDSTKLDKVLADPSQNIYKLFADSDGVSGFADQIGDKLKDMLSSTGIVDTRTTGLQSIVTRYSKQIEAMQARLVQVQARYTKQFSALDTTVAQLNQTGSYLTQALANL